MKLLARALRWLVCDFGRVTGHEVSYTMPAASASLRRAENTRTAERGLAADTAGNRSTQDSGYTLFAGGSVPRLAQLRVLALAAVLAIVFAGSRCGGPRDYLPAELRARVEALKADVRREPTTAETIAARNEVFWEWLNAYSLTGGPVPPNGPSVASWIFQTAFENERARGSLQDFEKLLEAEKATHRSALFPDDSLARQLDDLIYELAFKDEQPDGLGTLSLDAAGPFPIDSWQTIEQTYAVGSAPCGRERR